ncbi:MAG: transcriptional repressor [Polyangiaceae bacterium]
MFARQNPHVGGATVHRTLKLFVEAGVLQEHHFGDGASRFEVVDTDEHHHHLVCGRCGLIQEFREPSVERLQKVVAAEHSFLVKSYGLVLYGLCSTCAGRAREAYPCAALASLARCQSGL